MKQLHKIPSNVMVQLLRNMVDIVGVQRKLEKVDPSTLFTAHTVEVSSSYYSVNRTFVLDSILFTFSILCLVSDTDGIRYKTSLVAESLSRKRGGVYENFNPFKESEWFKLYTSTLKFVGDIKNRQP